MKVFIVLDDDSNIIGVYSSQRGAMDKVSEDENYNVNSYEVIEDVTEMKPITEIAKKEYNPLDLDDKMPFGKYRGYTLSDIIEVDPDYLEWCCNNTKVKITEDVKEYIKYVKGGKD